MPVAPDEPTDRMALAVAPVRNACVDGSFTLLFATESLPRAINELSSALA